MVANDPIHQWQGKWWFYDETWANQVGPFDTEEAARHACDKYCEELNYDAEPKIDHFSGRYKFLSNFFMANVVHDKVLYPSVEHAYQAAKTKNKKDREKIRLAPTAGIAKKLGNRLP